MIRRLLCYSLIAIGMLWSSSAARADTVRITAGITSFSSLAISFSNPFSAGTYITFNPGTIICPPGVDCTDPRFGFDPLCPDTGCGTGIGPATNVPLDVPNDGGTNVVFKVAGQSGAAPTNAIAFTPSGLLTGVNITGQFKLGTLSFTNGDWTDNADLGLTINAFDLTTGNDYTFNGFIHMFLTPQPATPDYVWLTDAGGSPLHSPDQVPLPGFGVPEGDTASVTLWGTTGSLDPTQFTDPTGTGFLNPSITGVSPVPEPSLAPFAAAGLLGIAWLRRRKNSTKGSPA